MKKLEIGTKLKSKNLSVKIGYKTQPFVSDVFTNKEEDIIYELTFGEDDIQNTILLRDYELFYTWKIDDKK